MRRDFSSAPDDPPHKPSFSELLTRRSEELGLFSAKEIARRLHDVNPRLQTADVARSVRNWQTGRTLPRPDYFRIVMTALEVDRDPALRAVWLRGYERARTAARDVGRTGPDGDEEDGAPDRQGSRPATPPRDRSGPEEQSASTTTASSPLQEPGSAAIGRPTASQASEEPSPSGFTRLLRFAIGTRVLAGVVALVAVTAILIAVFPLPQSVGLAAGRACDEAAGALWDPQRNPVSGFRYDDDIDPQAIGVCETAVAQNPKNGRYWFQLGRALSKARWLPQYRARTVTAYDTAVKLGYAPAALNLGLIYERDASDSGTGAEPMADGLRNAALMYEFAARAKLPLGLYCAALAHWHGWDGAPKDPNGALRLAQAAAATGYMRATGLLADFKDPAKGGIPTRCVNN